MDDNQVRALEEHFGFWDPTYLRQKAEAKALADAKVAVAAFHQAAADGRLNKEAALAKLPLIHIVETMIAAEDGEGILNILSS